MKRMAGTDTPTKKIQREPSPVIFIISLVRKLFRRKYLSEILCLHKPGIGDDLADGRHCLDDRAALGHDKSQATCLVRAVRVPESIKAAEASGRHRLVDRRESRYPRVPPCEPSGKRREAFGKIRR